MFRPFNVPESGGRGGRPQKLLLGYGFYTGKSRKLFHLHGPFSFSKIEGSPPTFFRKRNLESA